MFIACAMLLMVQEPEAPILPKIRPPVTLGTESDSSSPGKQQPKLKMPKAPRKPFVLSEKAQKLIRDLALVGIPEKFTDDKKWGSSKRIQSGLKVEFEKGRLKTHRRWKNVKHGKWQKYEGSLVDREKNFKLQIRNMSRTADGAMDFDIICSARIDISGRWQNWQLGVPMLRVSTDATADVYLNARCRLKIEMTSDFPPGVQLKPTVLRADVAVRNLNVRRISHLKGRVAREFSDPIEAVVKRELARRRKDLVKKLNKKIKKKEDKLKISFGDWLSASSEADDKESKETPRKKK